MARVSDQASAQTDRDLRDLRERYQESSETETGHDPSLGSPGESLADVLRSEPVGGGDPPKTSCRSVERVETSGAARIGPEECGEPGDRQTETGGGTRRRCRTVG